MPGIEFIDWLAMQNRMKQRPGFFTPYRSAGDFAETLTLPVTAPLILAGCSVCCAAIATALPAIAAASFIIAGIGALAKSESTVIPALVLGTVAGGIGLVAAIAIPLLAMLAVMSPFLATLGIVTRTSASIYAGIKSLLNCDEPRDEAYFPI